MKFYLVKHEYCGPNPQENLDASTIKIWNKPARTNGRGEVMIDGYCGTTNDWSRWAYGEYESIEEARAALVENFGECRLDQRAMDESADDECVEIYRIGKLIPMNRAETESWIYDAARHAIESSTTDEQIAALAIEYEANAEADGFELSDVSEILAEMRNNLLEDEEDDEENED